MASQVLEKVSSATQMAVGPGRRKRSGEVETDGDASIDPALPKDKENEDYIGGLRLLVVMGSITIVVFLLMLDMSIVSTAIPRITSEFHSLQDVGWYASAYQLASAALQPLTGKVYQYFSSKWSFVFFFVVFELGSLVCAVAKSSPVFIAGRAIAGLGSSGLVNGGITIIAGAVPLHRRPFHMGIMMGISQIGIICGPLIGGALTEYSTWRWCFYLNLPVGGVVGAFLVLTHIPDQMEKAPITLDHVLHTVLPDIDLLGFALLAPATIQFLLALQWGGNEYAWKDKTIIGLFCGAGATFAVFLLWDWRRGDRALIPFSIITNRVAWSSCAVNICVFSVVLASSYYMPIYFQAARGDSPTTSGVHMLPGILSQLLFAVVSGAAVSKLGYYLPWTIFAGVVIPIGSGLLSTLDPDTSTGKWVGYQIIQGVGRGANMQMPMLAIQSALPVSQLSIATAMLVFAQTFGSAVFISVAQTIFSNSLRGEIAARTPRIDPAAVVAAGGSAEGVRAVVAAYGGGDGLLRGVLEAYATSVDRVFYLAVGLSGLVLVFCWGMGWGDVRKKEGGAGGAAGAGAKGAAGTDAKESGTEGEKDAVRRRRSKEDSAV